MTGCNDLLWESALPAIDAPKSSPGCSFALQENMKMTAESRILELRAELDQHNYRYYVLDLSLIHI